MYPISRIPLIDKILSTKPWNTTIEFYGNEKLVDKVFHRIIAYNSKFSTVYILVNRDCGGLNPYEIAKYTRIYSGNIESILVSRCFKTNDLIVKLQDLLENKKPGLLAIKTPYFWFKEDHSDLNSMSRVTGLIHRLKNKGFRIVLFNTVCKNGYYKPSGGNYHHHVIDIILYLEKYNSKYLIVKLFKHPYMKTGSLLAPLKKPG